MRAGGVDDRLSRSVADRNAPGSAPAGAGRFDPAPWGAVRAIAPGEPLLFRYSALTFNSHRIHYDLPYAMGEEDYRGLVVHRPLTATLLLVLARRELGEQALATFSFRGLSPAIGNETLHPAMRAVDAGYELGGFSYRPQIMSGTAASSGCTDGMGDFA